ncbi:uncharacterized protein LOC111997362 [Quercus suber]|uniref:uncharacterized protein LOC111997362 n=1 Tax=Quercus suber TaxID=58331 RepID=UPI000CE178C4|nr:uncharacterized protein LOC111997362 [Quercus suber]XP_023885217.1 uncharacterized protein LOC111997362 [Quercus suber]POE69867.1 hypothetical protein CFP56_29451 [Quercus suber]
MEVEKRKRDGDKEEGEERKKVVRDRDLEVPSEEEVEEFFAILRRMKVAVNYFESNGEGWRAALENEEALEVEEVVDDEDEQDHKLELVKLRKKKNSNNNNNNKRLMGEEETGVLDLNAAAPEEAESNIGS